jgi:hypothetical protein
LGNEGDKGLGSELQYEQKKRVEQGAVLRVIGILRLTLEGLDENVFFNLTLREGGGTASCETYSTT